MQIIPKNISVKPEKLPSEHREIIKKIYGHALEDKFPSIWRHMLDIMLTNRKDIEAIWSILNENAAQATSEIVIDNTATILVFKQMVSWHTDTLKRNIDGINAFLDKQVKPAVLLDKVINELPYKIYRIDNYDKVEADLLSKMLNNRNEIKLGGKEIKCFMLGGAGTRASYICEHHPKARLSAMNLVRRFLDPNYDLADDQKMEMSTALTLLDKNHKEFEEVCAKEFLEVYKKDKLLTKEDAEKKASEHAKALLENFLNKLKDLLALLKEDEDKYKFILDQNMSVLKIMRYRFELENVILNEYERVKQHSDISYEDYLGNHMGNQMIHVSINNEIREEIEQLFRKYNFFGFKTENVIFTVTPNNVIFFPSAEGKCQIAIPEISEKDKTKVAVKCLKTNIKLNPIEAPELAEILKKIFTSKFTGQAKSEDFEQYDWLKAAEEFMNKHTIPNQGHGYLLMQSRMVGGSYAFRKNDETFERIPLTVMVNEEQKEVSAFQYMNHFNPEAFWNNQNIDDMDSLGFATDPSRLWELKDIKKHGYVFEFGENKDKTQGGSLVEASWVDDEGVIFSRLESWEGVAVKHTELVKKIFNRNPEVPYNRSSCKAILRFFPILRKMKKMRFRFIWA